MGWGFFGGGLRRPFVGRAVFFMSAISNFFRRGQLLGFFRPTPNRRGRRLIFWLVVNGGIK